MKSVHSWHVHKAAPLDSEASPINDDVNGTHVAHLPPEELAEVQVLRDSAEKKAPVDLSMLFVGSIEEAETSQLPESHAEPAVNKPLKVQTETSWVQLSPPQIVGQNRPRAPVVVSGREMKAFVPQENAKDESKNVQNGDAREKKRRT